MTFWSTTSQLTSCSRKNATRACSLVSDKPRPNALREYAKSCVWSTQKSWPTSSAYRKTSSTGRYRCYARSHRVTSRRRTGTPVTSFNGLVGDIIGVASFNGRTGDVMPQAGDYASGSGHPGSWLTDLPDSAHANDNEFDSTTLPSGWGWWKVGAAETPSGTPDPYSALAAGVSRVAYHTDFRRSHVVVQTPADSVERRLVKAGNIPTDARV